MAGKESGVMVGDMEWAGRGRRVGGMGGELGGREDCGARAAYDWWREEISG